MLRDPFARATKGILRRLGKDALLRGAPAGRVNIEHGVEVYERNDMGESVFQRAVATIESQYAPKQGDVLELFEDDGTPILPKYRIERLYQDGGAFVRRVVLPLTP